LFVVFFFLSSTGTSIEDLASFISDFYANNSKSTLATTSSLQQQQIDDDFLTFIWNTLVEQDDVRVGLLKNLEEEETLDQGGGAARAGPSNSQNDAQVQTGPNNERTAEPAAAVEEEEEEEEEDNDLKPTKKPSRKKPITATCSTTPTHELTLLPNSIASLGYSYLSTTYLTTNQQGGELRVLASPETAWKAITGSHSRPTAITPMVYQVLQMVSRGRGEGATAVRLSRELGVDPKSVFHYIKVPQQLGIVKKISAIDQGSRTNRILHIRYLSISPHWAVYTASEPNAAQGGGGGGGEGEDNNNDEGFIVREEGQMSTISALYLSTNPKLVRNRIVRALKARGDGSGKDLENCWMVQSEMASSIGLHSYSSLILRRLNALINGLVIDRVLEKVAVTKKNRKLTGKSKGQVESVSTVQALRLIDPDKLHKREFDYTPFYFSWNEGERDRERERELTTQKVNLSQLAKSHQESDGQQEGENVVVAAEDQEEEEEEEDDEHSYPLSNKSMQKQVLDLLLEADTRGLTNIVRYFLPSTSLISPHISRFPCFFHFYLERKSFVANRCSS
jgi:hypothetical protein